MAIGWTPASPPPKQPPPPPQLSPKLTLVNPHLLNVFEVRPVTAAGEQDPVDTGLTISSDFGGYEGFDEVAWNPIVGATAATVSHEVTGLDLKQNTTISRSDGSRERTETSLGIPWSRT